MNPVTISIIVAVSKNGVIGRDGDMPWRLSTDLKRFKALTMGKPMIMGRKTFESIGARPLPGRPHFVISREGDFNQPGVTTVRSLEDALKQATAAAHAGGQAEVCIVGGGEIYRQAMDFADILHVTHVEADIVGDTVFPAIDPERFSLETAQDVPAGERDNFPTRYAVYRRARGC